MLTINLITPRTELQSLPLNQSIRLTSSEPLELSFLEQKIVLIRLLDHTPIKSADLYNSNIGYIKNQYSTIPVELKIEGLEIEIDPIEPLSPDSDYVLFLDKDLSNEFVELSKTVSKGPSKLNLLQAASFKALENMVYKLKVVSQPHVTQTSNIVKLQLYVNDQTDQTFTINAKGSKTEFSFYGNKVSVPDVPFAMGEEFVLTVQGSRKHLEQNLILPIHTAPTADIKSLLDVDPSKPLGYEDVVAYYEKLNGNHTVKESFDFDKRGWEGEYFEIKHLDRRTFLVTIKGDLTVDNFDVQKIKVLGLPAFGRTDLEAVGLWYETQHDIEVEILDDKTFLMLAKEIHE